MATTRATKSTSAAPGKDVATPWGGATLVEQVALPQRAGERRFSTLVQLLQTKEGERLVRFAYSTDGVSRRGPVTLRARDAKRLAAALGEHPGLAEALSGLGGGGRAGGA